MGRCGLSLKGGALYHMCVCRYLPSQCADKIKAVNHPKTAFVWLIWFLNFFPNAFRRAMATFIFRDKVLSVTRLIVPSVYYTNIQADTYVEVVFTPHSLSILKILTTLIALQILTNIAKHWTLFENQIQANNIIVIHTKYKNFKK